MRLTAYHAKYAAHDLTKQAPPGADDLYPRIEALSTKDNGAAKVAPDLGLPASAMARPSALEAFG